MRSPAPFVNAGDLFAARLEDVLSPALSAHYDPPVFVLNEYVRLSGVLHITERGSHPPAFFTPLQRVLQSSCTTRLRSLEREAQRAATGIAWVRELKGIDLGVDL